jgi:hypothetical protein
MASVIQKQTLTIWCGTIGLATSLVVGCGSSKPPAPPVAAPAAAAPAGGHMPMMAAAPGAHGASPAPGQAPMHGQAPGGGHGMPMPGAPSSAHAGPTAHGAPSSAHAAMPGSPSMTPAQMMANAHGQAPTSGSPAAGPTSANPAMAHHGQAGPGGPGQPNGPATMPAGHGQGAPGSNMTPMPMPLPGGGHNQPGVVPANMAAAAGAAAAAGPGGAHAGNPAAMGVPGALNAGGLGIPGGAAAASQFEPGSAEEALAKFCVAMADINLTEAAEYISPKAKGLLATIRDGSISEEKTDELKESFSPQGMTKLNARQTGVGKAINLGNAKHELLSFTLMREADDAYLLREFKVSKLPTNTRVPGRR